MIKNIFFKLFKKSLLANTYSQAGEDKILELLFNSIGLNEISYIDIGSNHPKLSNNTYLFYCKGGKGLLVEPDPIFAKSSKKYRPGDTVIEAAISDKESGETDFFIFNEPAISTLSEAEAKARQESGKFFLKETKKVKLLTIENIITYYLNNIMPHLISLDVEGVDSLVLQSFDFNKYPIPVWVIETCAYTETHIKPKNNLISELMESKGYFVYGDTYVNTIFVNKNWFHQYGSR